MSEHDGDPRFFGIYRGKVHDVNDPTKRGRLLVQVPQVNGTGELDWALPCFPYLTQTPKVTTQGSNAGGPLTGVGKTAKITLRLPKRGDPVWVMFEAGNPDRPVWLGTWLGM